MLNADTLTRIRYRFLPDHLIGEILAKRWIDNAVPFLALVVLTAVFGIIAPGFLSASSITDLGRQVAEFGLIVLGLSIVLMSGGIDLSVGFGVHAGGPCFADRHQCRESVGLD